MRFLPIVERELRVASRRPRTYRSRCISALISLAFAAYFFWVFSYITMGTAPGRSIFLLLAQFTFVYCLFAGVAATADCLSSEKREGTMGFLFLTHLNSYDIVLGKLLSSSLKSVYGVIATVPASALCLLLGGVHSGEFCRIVLALLNTLFFSLSIGMFVSSISRQERKAAQTAAGVMVLFGFVVPLLGEWLSRKGNELGFFLRVLSPAHMLNFSTIPTASVRYFWWSFLVLHLISWCLLASVCWILPRSWQDRISSSEKMAWRHRWRLRLLGNSDRRRSFRRRLVDKNPFYWLVARARGTMVETWIIYTLILILNSCAAWFFHAIVPLFIFCVITAVLLHIVFKGQFCAASCERLAEDKQNGTLEVLLATPLSVRDILRGQSRALFRQFGPIFAAVVVLDFLLLLTALVAHEPDFFQEPEMERHCVLTCVGALLMLAADAVALGFVGAWEALAARQLMAARSHSLFMVLFVPWIALILLITFVGLYSSQSNWFRNLKFEHFLGVWLALGLANNLGLVLWARSKLRANFRIMATERFQPSKTSFFKISAFGWKPRSEAAPAWP